MPETKQETKLSSIPKTKIYIVTAKTGSETYLIEAYKDEAPAITHVSNAIEWYTKWTAQPTQATALHYSIWPEKQNPFDNITPDIIDDSIIYDYQKVNINHFVK